MLIHALRLIALLNEMGTRDSNPVLEFLDSDIPLLEETKYPSGNQTLGNQHWRAFYHCHSVKDKPEAEHGHIHIFINAENVSDTARWPHLIALSVDDMGQPIQWFTVNQWVTKGDWLAAQDLINSLSVCSVDEDMSLTEKWLVTMLDVYQEELEQLLLTRDACLNNRGPQKSHNDMLKDRNIYTLSRQSIHLQNKLETVFNTNPAQSGLM